MNSGTFGFPTNPEYTDYILGRVLAAGQPWDIPAVMPAGSSAMFEFEFIDGASLAASVEFRFNGEPQANHTHQLAQATGTSFAGQAVNSGLFATFEAGGLGVGFGQLMVGERRIVYNSQCYRGTPGVSIWIQQWTGILFKSTLAVQPYNAQGLNKLQILSVGTIGKGSRFRLYAPKPMLKNS